MNLNFQIRFYTEDDIWICFKHAVMEVLKGTDVKTEIDDYNSDNVLYRTYCIKCTMEE